MSPEEHSKLREFIELEYALICKACSRKVIDPSKNNGNQVFTKNRCPHCNLSKEDLKTKSINVIC